MELYYNAGFRHHGRFQRYSTGEHTPELQPLDAALARLAQDANAERDDVFVTVLGFDSPDYGAAKQYGPLYFDLDCEDLEVAQREALAVLELLGGKFPLEAIHCHFSGGKGFHIEVDAAAVLTEPQDDLNLVWRLIAEQAKERLHLTTLDLQVYDRCRLWRLPMSYNTKGQAFKVPVSADMLRLYAPDQLRAYAQQPCTLSAEDDEPSSSEVWARGLAFIQKALAIYTSEQRTRARTYNPAHLPALPDDAVPCVAALTKQRLAAGEGRNAALWTLATFWRQQGLAKEGIVERVFTVNAQYQPPLERAEVSQILRSVMDNPKGVGCRTPTLEAACPGRRGCPYFTRPLKSDAGLTLTKVDGGYNATAEGWSLMLGRVSTAHNKLRATVRMVAPSGQTTAATVDLLSVSSVRGILSTLPVSDRDSAKSVLVALTASMTALAERGELVTDADARPPVIERDGCYLARRVGKDGDVSYMPITNFTMEVKRILKELTDTGDVLTVREIIFRGIDGGRSRPHRATRRDLATRSGFLEWANGCGDYSYTGTDQDLQLLKDAEVFDAGDVDEAYVLDHAGHSMLKPGLFLAKDLGVYQGTVLVPDDDGIFTVGEDRIQVRPLEFDEATGEGRGMPAFNVPEGYTPADLLAAKREMLDLLIQNLYDYRGWLAMGMAYAGFWLPELEHKYRQFPGLYCVGPMGSGKNTLVRWVMAAVGLRGSRVLNLPNSTLPALERYMGFYSGLPLVMDEFRNGDRMDAKVELMRDWYDRSGRGKAGVGSRVITRPVRGWMLVAGQDVSMDGALNSRFVRLIMQSRTRSRDQVLKQRIDQHMETWGGAVALDVLVRRHEQEAEFLRTVQEGQAFLQRRTAGIAMERTAYNYAVALAGWYSAFGDVATDEELRLFVEWVVYQVTLRHAEQEEAGEAATFLRDIAAMIGDNRLRGGEHYVYEQNVLHTDPDGSQRLINNALYLWLGGVHPLWCGWKHQMKSGSTFTQQALLYALQNEPYFLNEGILKWMPGGRTAHRCILLDVDQIGFMLSGEFTGR